MVDFKFETEGRQVVEAFAERVKGKTILITGPSEGSVDGEQQSLIVYGHPANILLLGRDEEKVRAVIDKMKTIDGSIVVSFIKADFDSLASVKEAVRKILDDASIPTIDVLIKNAGIMAAPYQKTVES